MKEIGKKLAEKRKSLNLTYQDISDATKLSLAHIKAIEAGDLDYFKDDLSYVRFYVRSYCKAVDVPYEKFKDDVLDSVDEYSTTMIMTVNDQHETIETSVDERIEAQKASKRSEGPQFAKKDRSSMAQNVRQSSRYRKTRKIDFAFLSLIVVIVLVIAILLYVGVGALLNKEDEPVKEPDIADVTPTPEKDVNKDDKKEEPVKSNVKMTQVANSSYQYEVSGIKAGDPVKLEVTFKAEGSFNLWRSQKQVEGAYGVYQKDQVYTLDTTFAANEKLTFNFWNYAGVKIKVNGQELDLDANTGLNQNNVRFIEFIFKGE